MTGRAGLVAVLVVASLLAATPAAAQGLNDVIVKLLSNNCTGLGITGGNTSSLSPDLARICAFPGTGGGASAGGSSVVEDRVGFEERQG